MKEEINWDSLPEERFSMYLKRISLVEYLLDDNITDSDKKMRKEQYMEEEQIGGRTIRNYISRYKKKGPLGLFFYYKKNKSLRVKDYELREKILALIKEKPTRTVPKLRELLSGDDLFKNKINRLSDRTIYRFLCENNFSYRERYAIHTNQTRRAYHQFEAPHSLSLVQGDARDGIWLPGDNNKPIKTYLFLWLDDYSRKILFGKYYTNEKLPNMADSFKYMVLRWGLPFRVYLDNGKVYVARQFYYILSHLNIKWIHHAPYKAHAKGKIEFCNGIINRDFQKEASLAGFQTIEELNTAFWAWCDLVYNKKVNSTTGQTPDDRFLKGLPKTHKRIDDLDEFNRLFLFRENRKINKYGRIKLYKNEYPVTKFVHGTTVTVRFDPFNLDEVFIYDGDNNYIETTSVSKKVNNRSPIIPEEKRKSVQQISLDSKNYFTRLREKHLQQQKENNQVNFTKIIKKEAGNNE